MNYSKIQKSIASIIIPFFFFGMVFNFPINIFNFSSAGDTKLYSLVSILVNEKIYDEVHNSVEIYAEDISKQLKNTKVVIIPTPVDVKSFNIASLNEKLYYEGYKGIKNNVDFKSRLVGTVLVGDFSLPVVYKDKEYSTTILPYVDFENKSYIYNHKTGKYEENPDNLEGIKPEIWHGIISPNLGNKDKNITAIKYFFKKDHNFYEGKGNFERNKGIINGKVNQSNPDKYEPYVFYFDQIREQKAIKYPNYIGYQAYLKNKEALSYNRYSKELAKKVQGDVLDFPQNQIKDLMSQIPDAPDIDMNNSPDLTKSSDIMTKAIIDKATKKFVEVINSSKLGEFRKDVNNAGRYSGVGNKVNIDMIPYIISVLDNISDQGVKGADKVIEEKIDNLVMSGGLSRYIALPTTIKFTTRSANTQIPGVSCNKEYTNILYGKVAEKIKLAEECSIYRGNNQEGGKLVEANRGLNIYNIANDTAVCKSQESNGYWGGNSPINLKNLDNTKGDLSLKTTDYKQAIRPIFDIKGSKSVSDDYKVTNPYNCYEGVNNYILSYREKTASCDAFLLPINGDEPEDQCSNNNEILPFPETFTQNYKEHLIKNCKRRSMILDSEFVIRGVEKDKEECFGADKGHSKLYSYKKIPSYIKHISPTPDELAGEINSKVSPNLPLDVVRYIDFIGAGGNKDQIKYPRLFEINEELSDKDKFKTQLEKVGIKLDRLLEEKSAEINAAITRNIPPTTSPEKEIYEQYLKIAPYPSGEFDLKDFLKNKETTTINIGGEEKELSYYDNIKFSLFWNNLDTVGQKYKFVFENYLSDQTNSEFKHYLPKNKKVYEIAYLGAPGNAKNMYIGINPEEKGKNPFSEIDKDNALLDAEIFSSSVKGSNSGNDSWGNDNIGTDNNSDNGTEAGTENENKENLFKCAPPEGVSIFEWPAAISCRIKNISVDIDFSGNRCSSETLFEDKNDETEEEKITSDIIDIETQNSIDGTTNDGGAENGDNNQDEPRICRNDLNKNGVEDCLEKDLEKSKIEIISSSKKVNINSYIGLESRIIDLNGKLLKKSNNVKTKFELIRIIDKKNNKLVPKKDFDKYIIFNENIIPSKRGKSKHSLNSKNKEADYYFKASAFLTGKDKKELFNIKSDTIKVQIRKDLFSSTLNKISKDNIFNNGENEILASDQKNIYLLDLNKSKLDKTLKQIKNSSNSSEKIIISLSHYSGGNKQISLNYPLKLSLTKNGKRVIEDINVTENNLSTFYPAYSITKKGEYKLKITNKYGETTTKTFNITPEKANNIDIHLSTNILEKNGNITSNIFILKDKYGNISDGFNYKVSLKSEGEFSFPLNLGENLSEKEVNVYEGYKGFRLKPGNKNGNGKIKIEVKYNDKIIATKSKIIQTLEKVNIDIKKPEKIEVGGNKVKFELEFKDKQGNLLKSLNTRIYLSINKNYGITKTPYFPVKNGKAIIDFKTKNLAGENIPIELKMEGLREIIKSSITIEPEKPIKLDFNISKNIAKASVDEKISVKVQLKDRYNNTVFNDNSTKLKIYIPNDYSNILKLDSSLVKTSTKGEALFNLKATSNPGTAYFKVSTIPDLEEPGVGEKAGKIKTYYFWDKNSFKNKKYNSIYTVMLGADYGNIKEKDYLAGSILFNKNNRSLAVTSLVNNPYKFSDLVSVYNNGKLKDVSSQNNLTQDLELTTSINSENKLFVNIYNRILNRQIGTINYIFDNKAKLGICETTIGECGILKNKNSIYLKNTDKDYVISEEDNSLFIKKDGINILEINEKGDFISNSLLKLEIDDESKEDFLVININSNDSKIAELIINISNDSKNIEFKITDSIYNVRDILLDGKSVKNIYYNNFLSKDDEISKFSKSRIDDIENFRKKGSIGWKGENKFLLDFAAGKKVGESIMDKQSFGIITLGDPVISLKPIQTTFKDGTTKKSFTATIGKKISSDVNIKSYKIFDYDNDNLDDILLIKDDGFLKLLENKPNAKDFVDKGNLAYIIDHGNKEFVKTGDFTGDGFDDIFFINDKDIPALLNNTNKDFNRFVLEEQFALKGKIVQAETFDMDADGKTDIITLDDSGEINIFYGGGTASNPSFIKKKIGSGSGLKLDSTPRNNGALISYDGLYQIPETPNTSTGIVDQGLLNRQIFVQVNQKADEQSGKSNKKTFIKSEYSKSAGIEIKKVFKDINGGTLQSGDIVEVEVTITNTSTSIKRNISYLDKVEKPFLQEKGKIEKTRGKIVNPTAGYNYSIKNFNLAPGGTNIIKYKLKTPALSYGNIKVGLFEKGELGDDIYGDIIIKKDKQNCSQNSKIYKSESKRTYDDLSNKPATCDSSKIKLPKQLEEAKKFGKDENKDGIPDFVEELKNNPEKAAQYSREQLNKFNEEETKNVNKDKSLNSLDKINEKVDEYVEDLDNLIEGFSCGFGGGSCISTPLNWAPLAPGNDPTLFGVPVGDGLRVSEGIPTFSSLTMGKPHTWPPNPGGAGGYFGVNNPLNTFRLFITPTLTGGVGTAICFGGPASVAGNSIPMGVSPIVPGGNCIVAAKPLLGCSNDGSEGDPESMGQADNFGGNSGAGRGGEGSGSQGSGGTGNGNNPFGVINGNCGTTQKKNNNQTLNKNFVDKYISGLGNPTTFTTAGFENDYKNAMGGFNDSLGGNLETPLFSLNGEGIGIQELDISADFSNNDDGNFEDVIQIQKDRVSAFPSFIMDWTTRQIEEIVTKLSDFPTLFIILPYFSGIVDTDWIEYGKKSGEEYNKAVEKEDNKNESIDKKIEKLQAEKNGLKCDGDDSTQCFNIDYKIKILQSQKIGNKVKGQNSGIKAAYQFLSNVPIIELEPQQINIDIPFPDENTLDKFIVDSKATLSQWKNEVSLGKINASANSNIQNLISNLEQNIEIAEEYKQFPRKLTKLLNQKEIRINQVMCSVEEISEITGGWIGRNGKRFKAWVETYILIKAVLKSWQLLIDVFTDYEAECHECKNERQDLLQFEFKLISFILPKFPIFQFPKWPDLILDLHNIRASINIKIPDVVINHRPLVLPNIPELTLPSVDANIELDIPEMPLLTRFEFPELPDLPTPPHIELPDLPPPPQLPKIFSKLEGVLKILKLITKAMCLLKQLPFVPEWRAGDQIAFLTERNGYLPTDFIDLSYPNFSLPYLDAIKVTTFVNLETDASFLVETLRDIISPLSDETNNWANKFSNAGLDHLDFSNKSINIDKKVNLKKDKKTGFSTSISRKITKLVSYIDEHKDEKVNSKEFLNLVNKSLASSTFTENSRSDEIIKLWKEVNNYNYSKENKLISELKINNAEKFDNLKEILKNELRKNYKLEQDLKNFKNKDESLFLKVSGEQQNKDFVNYKKSLEKYNKKFLISARKLIDSKGDIESKQIKKESNKLLARVNGGLKEFNNGKQNIIFPPLGTSFEKGRYSLLANNTPRNNRNTPQNSCQQGQSSGYNYNYKGLYIVEKNKSYRLFNYMDELKGNETYSSIDFDKDGDYDLLYFVNGELYLKENLNVTKNKDLSVETPLELKIPDNKYFNGEYFIEAINGFKEINTDNGFLNISFKSPTDKSIKHFVVEYYTIVDKFLNEEKIDNVNKNIIDAFVSDEKTGYKDNLTKKHFAYINYIGDIPAVRLDTFEMKDITESLINNNKVNISSTTPLYTANNSTKIEYYIGTNKDNILEKEIEENSSIRFSEKITIISTNGKIYTKGNKKINLSGEKIKKYIGLPLFKDSQLTVIPDLKSKMDNYATVEIKYGSGDSRSLNFSDINSYYYYKLGNISNDYLIKVPVYNDYYYGKIYAKKSTIIGTYSAQKLFSPQVQADTIAPEVEGLSQIRIPVYQKKKINIGDFIYEDSGIRGIKNFEIKVGTGSKIFPDNYKINKSPREINIDFGKFNTLFKEKIEFILEDNNGNKSKTMIDFEVYSPKPTILSNSGSKISGKIDEKLIDEPINIYRIRGGIIKRLKTNDNKIKVNTVDEGIFNFDSSGGSSNLLLKKNNLKVVEINETTGKIKIKNNDFKIKINSNTSLFPEISVNDLFGNKIYRQFLKLENNIETIKVNSFDSVEENGLYLKIDNSNYDSYNIPNGAQYSAGTAVIFRKNSSPNKRLFEIYPDGRIKYNNIKYYLSYKNSGEYIILELKSKIGNKKIAELLYKIRGTYLMK